MILVTGGAGFIGANFILDWLSLHDEPVLNLDKLTYAGNLDNLRVLDGDPRHVFAQGDIADAVRVAGLLTRYRPRAIINFAAESHVDRSIAGGEEFIQTNIVGVFRLLETARAYWSNLPPEERDGFRFLQVSTDEVYGSLSPSAAAFQESDRYEPNSPYSASKAAADHLVRASYRTYGLPVLTTNCANNYGPCQFPEKLIPHMIVAALNGQTLPVYGDGMQVRDWLYVKDHCKAVRRVLEAGRPGETYNIGSRDEKTNIEVVRSICRLLDELRPVDGGYEKLIKHVADRPGHDVRYAIDASKISDELGWKADQSFEAGLRETVNWYLAYPAWVERVRSHAQAV
ncbi:dTDP-glucose 4,6-dehydratase [Polaromonas aquatica]|uniref:dTDP-glucose 4,6-dehydratase n=1 Tax=Polaromonas aquatica TaxID=332657 RepID=UPI003D66059B